MVYRSSRTRSHSRQSDGQPGRSSSLLWDVYHWKTATRDRPFGWVDPPSGSILQLYAVVYGGVARTYEASHDTLHAQKADSIAREVNRELSGRALF